MSAAPSLRHAEGEAQIRACFPVMRELRPALADADTFVAQIARQYAAGYRLLAAWHGHVPVALAGYRVQENLLHGRYAYLDDLVATEPARRQGLGARLLDAVMAEARTADCRKLVLGTGLANALAHRFYYRQGLLATGLSFAMPLG